MSMAYIRLFQKTLCLKIIRVVQNAQYYLFLVARLDMLRK